VNLEALVRERQRLRVGLAKGDVQPFRVSSFFGAVEQRGHVVGRRHVAPAACRGERDVPIAGGDVEHALTRADIQGLAEALADDLQCRPDNGVVAGRPCSLLAGFDGGQIRLRLRSRGVCRRRRNQVHDHSPFGRSEKGAGGSAFRGALTVDVKRRARTWNAAW
jgi:hypothetical protein